MADTRHDEAVSRLNTYVHHLIFFSQRRVALELEKVLAERDNHVRHLTIQLQKEKLKHVVVVVDDESDVDDKCGKSEDWVHGMMVTKGDPVNGTNGF